jgi:hypothetical protein
VFIDNDRGQAFEPDGRGVAGLTVNLNDATGTVVATTVTDKNGNYSFTDQAGIPGTGRFNVSIVLPAGFTNVTAASIPIAITRGDLDFDKVNFGIARSLPLEPEIGSFTASP